MGLQDHLPEGFELPAGTSDRIEFWSHFWSASVTPWDLGKVHPELVARLDILGAPRPAYVPGCGRGHDALFLKSAGFAVTAVDFCPEVETLLAPKFESSDSRFLRRDALELAAHERYGLWWDHTFLCAIPLESRPRWAECVLRALQPGGLLAVLVFPVGKPAEEGGPPFGLAPDDVVALLGDRARLLIDEPCLAPGREKGERFALLEIC